MSRDRFMLLVGAFHLLHGSLFLFLTGSVAALFLNTPSAEAHLIMKVLGGISYAVGVMNLTARKSPDSHALLAVLLGTFFYLLCTVGGEIRWIQTGVLKPVAWVPIGIRLLFTCGYGYYLTGRKARIH